MRRLILPVLALLLIGAPAAAYARLGDGSSMGSRGGRTYSAPPSTGTSPYGASPMQRSMTPQGPGQSGGYAQPNPGYGGGYGYGRSGGFGSGLLGGLLGVGIGSMLFGRGMFGGFHGIGSVFSLLIQLLILFFVVRLVLRLVFSRQAATAGGRPSLFGFGGGGLGGGVGGQAATAPPRPNAAIQIAPQDLQYFQRLLVELQAAWSAQDLNAIRARATPEMAGYFAEQLADYASRGERNTVTDVRLERGDLSEAWTENGRDYATVAMRFSMLDTTRDASGRVVGGSDSVRAIATELWTFLRARGGAWVLSAIQQTR